MSFRLSQIPEIFILSASSAGVTQLVECYLPKVNVVSSSLITRYDKSDRNGSRLTKRLQSSRIRGCSSAVEHHVANVRVVSSNLITR